MKLDKHDVREKDAFLKLSDRIIDWISKNRTAILIVLAIVATSGIGYGIFDLYSTSAEKKAQEALYEARKKYDPAIATPFSNAAPTQPKLTPESVAAFEAVIRDHKGTKAAIVASIELSQAFLDESKIDEASRVLSELQRKPNSVLGALYNLQKAKVLEAGGKCSEAVTILEGVFNSKLDLKAIQNEAKLRAGICYEQLSQMEKAKELLEQVSREQGAAAESAKKYLHMLGTNAS